MSKVEMIRLLLGPLKRKIIIRLLLALSFLAHAGLFAHLLSEHTATFRDRFELELEALKGTNLSPYTPEGQEFIDRSRQKPQLNAIQKRRAQLEYFLSITTTTLALWPIGLSVWAFIAIRKLWLGNGLSPEDKRRRRERMLYAGLLSTSIVLIAAIVTWRHLSRDFIVTFPDYWLPLAALVALVGVLWCNMLRELIYPGRLHTALRTFSITSRLAPSLVILALVAGVSLQDISKFESMDANDIEYEAYKINRQFNFSTTKFIAAVELGSLIAQATFWSSIVFALGVVAMDYLRLPMSNPPVPRPANSASEESSVTTKGSHLDLAALGEGAPVAEELARLNALLGVTLERLNGRQVKIGGKPRSAHEVARERSIEIRDRLRSEIHSLTQRGNWNLLIGSFTSLIAAAILWMLVAEAPTTQEGAGTNFLHYYVPRISVAVFIEVFSFFFLRLYKSALSDIKYYQNELTNLETRLLALEIAGLSNPSGELATLLRDLSTLDRNGILKNGDSTVEIEKMKLEQQNLRSLVEGTLKAIPNFSTQK